MMKTSVPFVQITTALYYPSFAAFAAKRSHQFLHECAVDIVICTYTSDISLKQTSLAVAYNTSCSLCCVLFHALSK